MADDNFHRQRRNLLVVSAVVLFLAFSGGTIKELNLLGTRIAFEDPGLLLTGFSLLLVYLFVRYLQYCPELDASDFRRRLAEGIQRAAERIARKLGPQQLPELQRFRIVEYESIRNSRSEMTFRIAIRTPEDEDEEIMENINQREISVHRLRLVPAYIYTVLYIVVRTPWFTEYVLPPVLALSALWFAVQPSQRLLTVAP